MRAKDIMTVEVRTAKPDSTVEEIAAALLERSISALPVVDAEGRVLGIVSEGDLMRRPETGGEHRRSWWLHLVADRRDWARDYVKAHGRRAADVMTREVVAVDEETPVSEVADLLERHRIKRVPVLRDGRLVGILSRADLIRGLAAGKGAEQPAGARTDDELQESIEAALREEPWNGTPYVLVSVRDGVVRLSGLVESAEERRALQLLAESVPGVRAVEDATALRTSASYGI